MNRKDLVVLAADKDMEYVLKGLLSRPQALGIRKIEADIRVHPGHDPACAGRGVEYLSNFSEYYHEEGEVKPGRPKEAFQAALREARIPRSASLYQRIAEKVSLRGCEDRAFLKFKDLLKDWFPRDSQFRAIGIAGATGHPGVDSR